jgi:hypothetical protein
MLCAERESLRQRHQATVQSWISSIRDLVILVDNSAANSDFNLAHRRIRAARRAFETALDDLEDHQTKHGCFRF